MNILFCNADKFNAFNFHIACGNFIQYELLKYFLLNKKLLNKKRFFDAKDEEPWYHLYSWPAYVKYPANPIRLCKATSLVRNGDEPSFPTHPEFIRVSEMLLQSYLR